MGQAKVRIKLGTSLCLQDSQDLSRAKFTVDKVELDWMSKIESETNSKLLSNFLKVSPSQRSGETFQFSHLLAILFYLMR